MDPVEVMRRHAPMTDGPFKGWCAACPTSNHKRPCEPYLNAKALVEASGGAA